MGKFKGTQGIWKVYNSDDESITITNKNETQAIAFLPELFEDTTHNAKLIAAAPEMLEMINKLHLLLEEHLPNWYTLGHHKEIDILIKKITD